MSNLPSNPSQSFKKRNPELYEAYFKGQATKPLPQIRREILEKVSKRIRQGSKPLLNKLEQEWFDLLYPLHPNYERPIAQAITFRLANGLRYTPDVLAWSWPQLPLSRPNRVTCWEVKGKHAWDDSIVKIKVAATTYPAITWILAWKENGEWKTQQVLP